MSHYDSSLSASVTLSGEIPYDSVLSYGKFTENTPYTQGSHTGGNAEASLTDSAKSALWAADEWINFVVQNITASESATVTDNTTTNVTGTLSGLETWDNGDFYLLEHPTQFRDTKQAWSVNQWQTGFKAVNRTDDSSGSISSNTATDLIVASLSGGTNNAFRVGDEVQIVVDGIASGDKIYYSPQTTEPGKFRYQLYDDSDGSYSDVYTYTFTDAEGNPIAREGAVSLTTAGVPSIAVQAAAPAVSGSGGKFDRFWFKFDQLRERRKKRLQKHQDKIDDIRQIKGELDQQLVLAERQIEAQEGRDAELTRLTRLVEKHKPVIKKLGKPRVTMAANAAVKSKTYSKMERLERELTKARDQEQQFIDEATRLLLESV